jgi:chromosome segregation ATPase
MTRNLERRLLTLSGEISTLRAEIAILDEQLAFQQDVMEDARVRALVAETPLADREFRVASDDLRRIQRVTEDARTRLRALLEDQDRLLGELLPEVSTG